VSVVGIVVHRDRSEAVLLAKRAIGWLQERGHEVRIPADDAEVVGLSELACPDDTLCDDLRLAISLGGDFVTEERMTLEVGSDGKYPPVTALNEAWLEKTVPGHTVHMRLAIAGSWFTTYAADGLIVSTPTGSTAYNLSVRGPIVSPTLRAMVVKPVSPHQLFDFPLVLGPDEEVRVEVLEGRTATLLVDGRNIGELVPGDAITCRAGPHPAHLVRFGERDFHQILKAKFGLTDR
jgi:NAD+ kinase